MSHLLREPPSTPRLVSPARCGPGGSVRDDRGRSRAPPVFFAAFGDVPAVHTFENALHAGA
ncbi:MULTISPECIES: hypothetical protein [Halalkalicoccus]|uniref:hypothetical protein n=1 Tax=Halalkalicoccus TaxID=332246 RepID=UPI002F962E68